MGLNEVSEVLWRERNLLELLAYKLEAERLVVESGGDRWLAHAAREVETVCALIRETELERAMTVDAVARSLGLRPGATLRELSEAAPSPWCSLLTDHRAAFLALTDEIGALAAVNEQLLDRGAEAARASLDELLDRAAAADGHVTSRRPGTCRRSSGAGTGSRHTAVRPGGEITDVR